MKREDILLTPSMPASGPSYPKGPYRFVRREYLIITYETDPQVIRDVLPEPLQPARGNLMYFEWIKMPDSSGFGDYEEAGCGIPALLDGQPCNFSVQMYLDDGPPITGGREIWGFPKKYGSPTLQTVKDTLTGTLHYGGERVAMGTMAFKHRSLSQEHDRVAGEVAALNVNLKLLPDVDGQPKIAQLVGYNATDVHVHGAWEGPARLHLIPHVNCPVADLPVRRIVGGRHQIVDFTLPYGRVLHDYLV